MSRAWLWRATLSLKHGVARPRSLDDGVEQFPQKRFGIMGDLRLSLPLGTISAGLYPNLPGCFACQSLTERGLLSVPSP